MAIRKVNPQDVYLSRVMEQRNALIRKNAADTIRAAEKQVQHSEQIVSQAMTILERAEEVLNQIGRARARRREYAGVSEKPQQ